MLGLSFGKIPVLLVYAGAKLKSLHGRRAEPVHPTNEFEEENFENSCDSSACRYHFYFQKRLADRKLQTRTASLGWGMESAKACARVTSGFWASRIRIPVLLCQAGNDTVVKNDSQLKFLRHVPKAEFFRMPNMKHELYMTDSDMLIQYWERIFAFLDQKEN
jgi:lysophospholipase